jgi:hypothetical protein
MTKIKEARMRQIKLPALKGMIGPDTFKGPGSPGVLWLGQLYQALLPLARLKLPNSEDAVYMSIRTDGGYCTDIDPERDYAWDCKAHTASPDHRALGWWVCDITVNYVTKGNDYDTALMENLYYGDFLQKGFGVKRKLRRVFNALRVHSELPQFSPERIKQALEIFSSGT